MANSLKKVVNATRANVISDRTRVAANILSRLRGLLFSPALTPGEGLLIRPCSGIHMFGMHYPIDALFFDRELKVVGIVEGIAPGQMSRIYPSAVQCLELPCGTIANTSTQIGDQAEIHDLS